MLRTTVIGSYPFPGWLEFAAANLDEFGPADIAEVQDDAVVAALHDQLAAGLDVITDGEQTRLDFNLSFYGFLEGIELEARAAAPLRAAGARPARQARGHRRAARAARARRGRGIQAAAAARARHGADAEGQRPRPVHAQRPAAAERRSTRTAGR